MLNKLQNLFHLHNISGISCDSNNIKAGDAFFAIKGINFDGNNFITQAFNNGAKIAITDQMQNKNSDRIIYVENIRIALSLAASILYPKTPAALVGVTGTNGKTSVVSYCMQLYALLGEKAAALGTIGIQSSEKLIKFITNESSLTTLSPIAFRQILQYLVENNINYLAFEASSHGLDQARLYGVKAKIACFTSFSQDHLDYHKNMKDYLAAKLKLFTENLSNNGIAILNSETTEIDFITNHLKKNNINYFLVGKKGDLKINKIDQFINKQIIYFTFESKDYSFETNIIGSFQASNLLIAALVVHKTGFDFTKIIKQLSKIQAVAGRLEKITNNDSNRHVFVDYAHTPDALEKTLNELKQLKSPTGKLYVIFGAGGNRDISKRPLMGEVAAKIADHVIITDDNPRNEDPASIRKQIAKNIDLYIEIPDRKEAIIQIINKLQDNDILLIAGKGHEEYQIIGNEKIPFSDMKIAKEALQ